MVADAIWKLAGPPRHRHWRPERFSHRHGLKVEWLNAVAHRRCCKIVKKIRPPDRPRHKWENMAGADQIGSSLFDRDSSLATQFNGGRQFCYSLCRVPLMTPRPICKPPGNKSSARRFHLLYWTYTHAILPKQLLLINNSNGTTSSPSFKKRCTSNEKPQNLNHKLNFSLILKLFAFFIFKNFEFWIFISVVISSHPRSLLSTDKFIQEPTAMPNQKKGGE